MIREISGSILSSPSETINVTRAKGRAMCEFVGDDVDMKTLSESDKKKLRDHLERRKEQLQKRVYELDEAIQKIK